MKLIIVCLLSIGSFASELGLITEATTSRWQFSLTILNLSDNSFDATEYLLDWNGYVQAVGPFTIAPQGSIETGVGGFDTSGTWTVGIDDFLVTSGFAAIGQSLTVEIERPQPPITAPRLPVRTAEPTAGVLLFAGILTSALRGRNPRRCRIGRARSTTAQKSCAQRFSLAW